MIKRFSDLAANERTYLSWIRTAIALIAFGFLIEKFELFFRIVSTRLKLDAHHPELSQTIEAVGIGMMIMAVFIIIGASVRYIIQRKNIIDDKERAHSMGNMGIIMALCLSAISILLVVYIFISVYHG